MVWGPVDVATGFLEVLGRGGGAVAFDSGGHHFEIIIIKDGEMVVGFRESIDGVDNPKVMNMVEAHGDWIGSFGFRR